MAVKLFKIIFYPILLVLGALSAYLLIALVGMLIPVDNPKIAPGQDVEIFVQTNGLHADLVLPSKNDIKDWGSLLPLDQQTRGQFNYMAIGWGEKNFYLNTPTMSDLTFPTLVKALLIPSEAAMHVEYRRYKPSGDNTSSIMISEEMYEMLVGYILDYFIFEEGKPKLYPQRGYHEYDDFYAAKGKYHAFWTCNNWTNTALKKIGVKNSLWTPMDWGVFFYLD